MPMYEFECKEHGVFEDLVPAEINLSSCPECGSECVRLISAHKGYAIKGDNSGSTPKRGKL